MSTLEKERAPLAVQISVSRSFDKEGSGANWVTSVKQDDSLEEINAVSDKIMAAISRQEIWARADALNTEIEMHLKQRAQVMFTIKSMEKRYGDFSRANVDAKNAYHQSQEGLLRIDLLVEALRVEQDRLLEGLK